MIKTSTEFIVGKHHRIIAEKLEKIASGELKRLIINMPPRHTKSEFASYLLPAWFLGQFPQKKVIQTSHTAELAVGFGRKVRNLVSSDAYKTIFPTVDLQSDSKAAGRWNTNAGGDYFAIGVGGAVTGKGADLLIIDDPHSEQDAMNMSALERAYEWYTSGPRQRLQPGGKIVYATCSLLPEENQEQIAFFEENYPVKAEKPFLSTLPYLDQMDGFFGATLTLKN